MQSKIEIKIEKEDINQILEELKKIESIIKVYEGFAIKIDIQMIIDQKVEKPTPRAKPKQSKPRQSKPPGFPVYDEKSRSVLA